MIYVRLTGVGAEAARMVDETIVELDREIYATAETDPGDVIRVVDAIESLACRERRLRIRRR
ncbi:MAG: hypothetical protein ACXWWR_08265 [Candidatus Limnocylindrales bacterium]